MRNWRLTALGGILVAFGVGGMVATALRWNYTPWLFAVAIAAIGIWLVDSGAFGARLFNAAPERITEQAHALAAWYRISVATALGSALCLITLVTAALHWEWVSDRVGGVLTPLGAVVVAASASAGAARTVIAQGAITEANRLDDAQGLMWKRFDEGAKQLSDKHFATRIAGVHSLVGLSDDWLRHHQRRAELGMGLSGAAVECETIVYTLCAQLRRNTHQIAGLSPTELSEENLVNETICGHLGWHLLKNDQRPEENGTWADLGLLIDLRGVDLSTVIWRGVDLESAVLKRADLFDADLRGAVLGGADMQWADVRKAHLDDATISSATQLDNVIFDDETRWPTSVQTTSSLGQWRAILSHNGITVEAWRIPKGLARRQPR